MRIIYHNYGYQSLAAKGNVIPYPSGVSFNNTRGVIVRYGDYIFPTPNIDGNTGNISDSSSVLITLNSVGVGITTEGSWASRLLTILFFIDP